MESAQHYEIANVIASLAVHVDARRWDDLASLFAPEVRIDYTSLFGGEVQVLNRHALMNQWRQLLPGFTRTTHVIGNPVISISDVEAKAIASVIAFHVLNDPALAGNDQWLVGGCYELILKKEDQAWCITSLTLARAWSRGNPELPKLARERASRSG